MTADLAAADTCELHIEGFRWCAGHYGNRIWVITAGCLVWGVMTLGFSVSRSLREAIFFWAINGLGLSLVIPNVQVRITQTALS